MVRLMISKSIYTKARSIRWGEIRNCWVKLTADALAESIYMWQVIGSRFELL